MKTCDFCGKILTTNQRHNKYCGNECANAAKMESKIKLWLNGEYTGSLKNGQISKTIRTYLMKQHNYCCELCGWGQINPTTGKVPLELHHIDGNYLNNNINNLQILCPNCHSLTPNYKALNENKNTRTRTQTKKNYCIDCGIEITYQALRCIKCAGLNKRQKKPVTREELKILIRTLPFTTIGKQFNVTDNAIKKWCISYNLPSKKKDIKMYSDEQWALL